MGGAVERVRRLFRLQELDLEEGKIRRRLSEIEAALGETAALRSAREAAEKARERARDLSVRQQDLELQIEGLKKKIADSERRLYSGSVRNPKELSDLQAEVASLRRRLDRLEEDLLETMIAREEAEEEDRTAQANLKRVETEWSSEQGALREEKERLEGRLEEIAADRAGLLPAIPPVDLETYRALQVAKGGLVVARVVNDACIGCGMEVPSARLQAAKAGDLVFCGNCERILLVEE